jgi:tetratricopeptide (TPR) repeat protein
MMRDRLQGRIDMAGFAYLRAATISAAFACVTSFPSNAFAVGGEQRVPDPPPPPPPTRSDQKPAPKPQSKDKKDERRSDRHFIDGYNAARQLVLDGQYETAIAAFLALDADDDADVANYVGFAHRKAGRYELSQIWYEKALAADPKHTRTWQYYGMWHLENGNALKAQDHLERIRLICGGECKDYKLLRDAIVEGKIGY